MGKVRVVEKDEAGGPFYIGAFETTPDDDEPLRLFIFDTPIGCSSSTALMKSLNAVMRGFGWRDGRGFDERIGIYDIYWSEGIVSPFVNDYLKWLRKNLLVDIHVDEHGTFDRKYYPNKPCLCCKGAV